MTDFLHKSIFELFDSSTTPLRSQTYAHFALGDAFIRRVNQPNRSAIAHFWPIENMVILGMMDTKLPYLADGVSLLENKGAQVVVRPAGGLAVVADPGILNFSLILPEADDEKISIDDGYQVMVDLISQVFAPYGKAIEAYEIVDSYCPGKFDLSIDGKKFAGIAQRRFKKGIAIMIYMSVEGDQNGRGKLIQVFYDVGLKGEETQWSFPLVNPDSMANLSDLLDTPLTVAQVKQMIIDTLTKQGNHLVEGDYTADIMTAYHDAYTKMEKRNRQLFGK
jgi:octanoyl-[GcvH]:protein N-octanoyltransferase